MEEKLKRNKKYEYEIDGVRALAVLAVILNHFNKDFLPSGYLGVDMFFVISGYVITNSLIRKKFYGFQEFIISFYVRRIKRLIPLLVIFSIIATLLICFFNPDPSTSLKTGFFSLLGISNIYLFNLSTDYFASSSDLNIFTHTWSLSVEAQFYLFFPFLIWFSGFYKNDKISIRLLLVILVLISFTSWVSFLYFYQVNQPAAYFLTPNRIWEIAFGCILSLILFGKKNIFKNFSKFHMN